MEDSSARLFQRFLELDLLPLSAHASDLETLVLAVSHEQRPVVSELTQARLVKLSQGAVTQALREFLDQVSVKIEEVETSVVERADDD